jgi:Rod binding domain-containing protein
MDGLNGIGPMRPDMVSLMTATGPGQLAGGPDAMPGRGAKEIESYFIGYLMKMMRDTVPKTGLFGKASGEQFRFFYDQEIGRLAAERGGLGLAQMIEEDMKKKGFSPTDSNRSSSAPALPIQGPKETPGPSGSGGPHRGKG